MNFNSKLFKYWPLNKYEAITLPWGVYFKYSLEQTKTSIICHEQVHLNQRENLGTIKFYTIYLKEYLSNLIKFREHDKAYRAISFEIEAYSKCI